jgi:hypothetical protein
MDRASSLRKEEYPLPIRQLIITDLGHEEPTLLLTNQMRRPAKELIGRQVSSDN